jgi:hypothetical protein
MGKPPHTTSLWSVIETMQRRLEAEGMARDVVDVAVTRGLEALLDLEPPRLATPPGRAGARRRAVRGTSMAKA